MKTAPKILRIALVTLALAGIGSWAWNSFAPQESATPTTTATSTAAPLPESEHMVLVTYFTSDQRCPTCLKIEELARAAVETGFANELAQNEVRFQITNFDQPENKHFVDDYELAFKTVVIADRRQGKEVTWKKFDKVWDLVGEPEAFTAYLQEGVQNYLTPDDA